jgi:RNA recognition motif-containing protein
LLRPLSSGKLLKVINIYWPINVIGNCFYFYKSDFFMNIYLGNLPYSATEASIRDLFEGFGAVTTTKIVTDKFTGASRGFGFVEMPNDDEAQKAIAELNGKEFQGRKLVVNESRPRETTGGYSNNSRGPRREGGFSRDGGRNSRY